MKKLLFLILLLPVFNGCENYLEKRIKAEESAKLDQRILELNSINRTYLSEGVYLTRHKNIQSYEYTDKYGEKVSGYKDLGYIEYEVSLTSDKIVIANEKKHIIEELIIRNPYKISELYAKHTTYNFYISCRRIINTRTGKVLLEQFPEHCDSEVNKCVGRISLSVSAGNIFTLWGYIYIFDFDGTGDLEEQTVRPWVRSITLFNLESVKYLYNRGTPKYAKEAVYEEGLIDPSFKY